MNKEASALILISVLLLGAYIPVASAHNAPFPPGYDPTHLVIDTIVDPETVDPAWAYDTASGGVIMNVYETLIFYDVNYELGAHAGIGPGKTGAGLTDSFHGALSTAVPTFGNGLIDYNTHIINPITGTPYFSSWYFPIRTGVYFHPWVARNGSAYSNIQLTPEDVAYSMEREMIQDRDGGPQWMLYEPLLQEYYADPTAAGGVKIQNAVQYNSTFVWFNLVAAYPELAFKQILAQSWSSVVCKAWAKDRGDFDGDWSRSWTDIYADWHNPAVSFLDSPSPGMVGTGPYKFSYWNRGTDYSVVRNVNYWQGWPAPCKASGGPAGDLPLTIGGYVEIVTWREQADWTVRRGNFLSGTSDVTYVPRLNRDPPPIDFGVLGEIVGGELIRCYYPVSPVLACDAFFFTFDISPTSKYMGTPLPPGTFNTNGIPPDIFSDINVRKGFALAFNYNKYLAMAYLNEGTQPADPVIAGLAYDNPANNKYSYLLHGAYSSEYYLKLSWGGKDPNNDGIVAAGDEGALWKGGMTFEVVYNIGNVAREKASIEICNEINSEQPPKFFLVPLGLDWGTQVLPAMMASELPLFPMGWSADFADPHDFVFPFQHSLGTFSQYQRYGNPVVDALIVAGIATPDDAGGDTAYAAAGKPMDNVSPILNGKMSNVGAGKTYGTDWRSWPTDPNAYLAAKGGTPLDSTWPRRAIYYALQEIYYDDVPSVPIVQPLGRHWEQAWMRGWYYNSLYGGSLTSGIDSTGPSTPTLYAYHLWKALTHFGDVSSPGAFGIPDGRVDSYDTAFISAHWSSPKLGYGYHPSADINGGLGATTGGLTGPVKGMPDGKVDIVDLGLIAAYWDH